MPTRGGARGAPDGGVVLDVDAADDRGVRRDEHGRAELRPLVEEVHHGAVPADPLVEEPVVLGAAAHAFDRLTSLPEPTADPDDHAAESHDATVVLHRAEGARS